MISWVGPRFEIPAHTGTLMGCFGCSHFQWKLSLLWFSSRTEHSSVNITSPNCSFTRRLISLSSNLLTLFGSRISWLYCVAVWVHPSFLLRHLIFFRGELDAKASMDSTGQLLWCQFIISLHFSINKIREVECNAERWSSRFWRIFEWLSFFESFQKLDNAPMAYLHFIFSENSCNSVGPSPFSFSRTILLFLAFLLLIGIKPIVHI